MDQKIAIVTGAARGIGLATAQLLTRGGWKVAMVDRDGDELSKASKIMPGALALKFDVSVPNQVEAMAKDVLNRETMATNLDGAFLVSQAALPALKKKKGCIVNIASISGLRASTLRVAYGTSKAALIHLTKQQAAELGEFGIRANCVCPGPVKTKLAMAVHSKEIIEAYHDAIPLNRYGTEAEVAETIGFLCSSKASYVTGQILAADGGFESTGVGLPALRK